MLRSMEFVQVGGCDVSNGNDDGGLEVRWGLFVDAIGADGLGKMSLKVVSEGVVASK